MAIEPHGPHQYGGLYSTAGATATTGAITGAVVAGSVVDVNMVPFQNLHVAAYGTYSISNTSNATMTFEIGPGIRWAMQTGGGSQVLLGNPIATATASAPATATASGTISVAGWMEGSKTQGPWGPYANIYNHFDAEHSSASATVTMDIVAWWRK